VTVRNRIKAHVRVRAADLVPHELNPRTHGPAQRDALAALLGEIGFARSVLAYEVTCSDCRGSGQEVAGVGHGERTTCVACKGAGRRLKLIDGHLRKDTLDPDALIDVEVLDVDDDEARKLLLSIDPLAQLAGYDQAALDDLRAVTASDNAVLNDLWAAVGRSADATAAALDDAEKAARPRKPKPETIPEQFMVLVDCRDEQEQLALLRRFKAEGLKCKALMS
jgi:hypothetical protein